jgi:hypothetical protein
MAIFGETFTRPKFEKKEDMRVTRYGGGVKSGGGHHVCVCTSVKHGTFWGGCENTNYMTNANGDPTSHKKHTHTRLDVKICQ